MKGLKLHGKDLIAIGFPEGRAIGIAINVMLKHHRKTKKEDVLDELKRIAASPMHTATTNTMHPSPMP